MDMVDDACVQDGNECIKLRVRTTFSVQPFLQCSCLYNRIENVFVGVSLLMFKLGKHWYHFYNVFSMTRFLTGLGD